MRRCTIAVLIGLLVTVASAAHAQSTLLPGGLTALAPAGGLSANLVTNGGFEAVSGGEPVSWSTGSGWAADQTVVHSGSYSYRFGGGPTAQQLVQLKAGGVYTLSGWVKTSNLGGGGTGVRLTLDFRPGGVNEWSPSAVISGTQNWTQIVIPNVVAPQDLTAAVELENYAGASGTAWFDDIQLVQQLPAALDVFMLYPNYRGMLFDDQTSSMSFDVTVNPPSGNLSGYKVHAALAAQSSGTVVASQDYPAAAHFVAQLDGSAMQVGTAYQVTVSLVDLSTGATVYGYPAYQVSKVPGTARASMNVSFDAKNRILLHGAPRFVLGVYDSGLGYTTDQATWEQMLFAPGGDRQLGELPLNMYLNYWYGSAGTTSMDTLMADLQSHGVMYLQTGNCFNTSATDPNFLINSSDSYVQDIGSQAGSAGYYTADECVNTLVPDTFNHYLRLRSLDPDSMTFAALVSDPSLYMWRDSADVLATDPYPMYGAEPAGGYPQYEVADFTDNTRNAVKNARPYLTVLQFFQFTSQGRWPTLAEMRTHAYMAIVEGAHGLFWWSLGSNALADVCSGWCVQKTAYMNQLASVMSELAALEPVLLADDTAGALTGNSNTSAIRTKVKVVNGKGYVFAYNYTNGTVPVTLTWNTAPGTITVNAENYTVTPSGNNFSDTFGPYAAHVYVIQNGGSGGTTTGGTGGAGGSTALAVSFTNPTAGATVSGTTTVTEAATGGSGGYTYKLSVDGSNVYTGTNASFSWNTTNVTNGQHTLSATVTDSSNATATASVTVTVSNTVATPSPTGTLSVAMTAPTAGQTVSGTSWAVLWLSGQSGTSNTYTLSMGGQVLASQVTSATSAVSIPYDTTKVANGTQTLVASVTDATGNTGSTSATVTVSNVAPTPTLSASFTTPTAGATVSGTVTVGMADTGASGSSTFKLAVDGTVVSTQTVSGSTASYAWSTTSLANGSHALALTVTDGSGQTATANETVTVSNTVATALSVSFTSPKAGATVGGTTTVSEAATGGAGGYTYALAVDGAAVYTGTSASFSWNTTTVANGQHTLQATVTDASGQKATASETVNVSNKAHKRH